MAISNRKFGVEIECFGATEAQISDAFSSIGVECYRDNRSSDVVSAWKLTTDGSVLNNSNTSLNCWEIVSPPLSGEEGLRQVNKVANALVGIGISVNRSCGLHIHVDASDLNGPDLACVAMRYAKFERNIDSFMPVSRRENTYCHGMASVSRSIQQIERIESMTARNVANNISGRYYKLNLQAYLRHGTVEFRQHSGTVNGTKITNWIRFCVNFVEHSKMTTNRYRESVVTVPVNSVARPVVAVENLENLHNAALPQYDANGQMIHYIQNGYLTYSMRQVVVALNENITNGDGFGLTIEQLAQIIHCSPASIPAVISGIRRVYNIGTRILRKNRFTGKYLLRNRGHIFALNRSAISEPRFAPIPANNVPAVVAETRTIRVPNWEFAGESWSDGLDCEVISFYNERSMELTQ